MSSDQIKVFIRGGATIPSQSPAQTTAQTRLEDFTLFSALDHNGESCGELFWDDGDSLDTIQDGKYKLIQFSVVNVRLYE